MSKSYISEIAKSVPKSGIGDLFDVADRLENVISLGVGEPDFKTPWYARAAAIDALEKAKTSYTAPAGLLKLREEISKYTKERFDIEYDFETQVITTIGASEGVDLAMRTLLNPGDEVLLVEPCYVSYTPCVLMAGGKPIIINTKAENEFRLKAYEIEEKITPKTKVIFISFPSNPTGAIMERKDLEEIAEVIKKHDLIVISDEIYSELTYGGIRHTSIASIEGMYERSIVLNGFSKAFAMTGWRLGYALGPSEIIQTMNKLHQYITMCAPTITQLAAIAALTNEKRDDDIDIMREAYDERRKVLVKGFRDMGLDCFEPKGAFYVFPSIQKTGFSSQEFARKLLEDQRVAVVPGGAFGEGGEGFIRCSYAYSIDNIKEALERIEKFVSKYVK